MTRGAPSQLVAKSHEVQFLLQTVPRGGPTQDASCRTQGRQSQGQEGLSSGNPGYWDTPVRQYRAEVKGKAKKS